MRVSLPPEEDEEELLEEEPPEDDEEADEEDPLEDEGVDEESLPPLENELPSLGVAEVPLSSEEFELVGPKFMSQLANTNMALKAGINLKVFFTFVCLLYR